MAVMKRYEIQGGFGLDNLKMVEAEIPEPGTHEVLVKMKAVSLNFRDLMMVEGIYNPKQSLPLTPLSDGCGEVAAVGRAVTRWKPGDRVCTSFFQKWSKGEPGIEELRSTLGGPLPGTLAEYQLFSEQGLVEPPEELDDVAAATLPCAGVTAWNALMVHGPVRPGETVLTLGSGGVSTFAVLFAKAAGARVVATTGDKKKEEKLKALGADLVINYRETPAWGDLARELTGGEGVDLVVEVGGAGTLEQSIRAVRFHGRISVIGVLSGSRTELDLRPLLMKGIRLQGVFVGSRESFEKMNKAISQNGLKPAVDRVFSFDQAKEAFAYMKSQAHFGKICIKVE